MSDMRKAAKEGEVWVPSVTSIQDILAKHGLIIRKIDQHLEIAFTRMETLKRDCDGIDPYKYDVIRLTELQMDIAPNLGTDCHKFMENYMNE